MTAARDRWTGVVSVSVGSATQKVVVFDDPAVLIVLLSDGQSAFGGVGAAALLQHRCRAWCRRCGGDGVIPRSSAMA